MSIISPLMVASPYISAFTQQREWMYILDKAGNLIDCTRFLLHFLGCHDLKDIPDRSIYTLFHQKGLLTSAQAPSFQTEDLQVILSGEAKVSEQSTITDRGAVMYLEIARTPLMDEQGNALGLLVTIHNLTEQKALQQQVKDFKKQIRYKISTNTLPEDANPLPLRPLKVLIVEDNQIDQKVEKSILMNFRCITDIASSPKQAKDMFQPGKYDLVLMDLGLEEGNGYRLTGSLRQKEQGTQYRVPIIALTGRNIEVVGFECEDVEMDGILSKPLTPEQAKQLLQRYVRHLNVFVEGLKEFKQ